MTTKRLYYDDPYLTGFTALVVNRRADAQGPMVALNQTAFYPEGGGQPADLGTLNGVQVIDVQAVDGTVWHRVETQIAQKSVTGEVLWSRRFDHMQQHHGQHLLSAAFENLFGYQTTSFHLGARRVTIDLATPSVSDEELAQAEKEANTIVWENRPIHARFVSAQELASLPLRKQPTVTGPVRIVSVAGFDHSPCGGTHPNATGTVGIIRVSKAERRGEETRIEFACGQRVLDDMRAAQTVLRTLTSVLTVGTHELEDAVLRLRDSETTNRRQLEAARKELLQVELRALMESAPRVNGTPVVSKRFTARPFSELQAMAQSIAEAGGIAILATASDRAQVVVGRPDALDLDCAAILRAALGPLGGSGGGRPALASGGLPDPERLENLMSALTKEIEKAFPAT